MDNTVTELLMRIDQIGEGFSQRAYGIVGAEIMPLLKVAFVLYVALYGVQLIMGTAKMSVSEFVGRTARLMLILAFTQNWEVFNTLFFKWLSDTPEDVGRAILTASGTGISDPTNGMSMIVKTANDAAAGLARQSGYFTILPSVLGIVIIFFAMIFVGIAMAIIMLAKVMMWMLVGTAPIFIACLLFEKTRSLGMAWFSQVLLYALIPLFVFVVAAFMIAAINPELSKIDVAVSSSVLSLTHIASFILLTIAGSFVLINIQSLAQGIAGGISAQIGPAGSRLGLLATAIPAMAAVRMIGSIGGGNRQSGGSPPGGTVTNRSDQAAMQDRISSYSRPQ